MKCHNTEKEKKYLKIHCIKKYDATQIIGKKFSGFADKKHK